MIFKIRCRGRGEHVYCQLFIAAAPKQTFAYCGSFIVRRGAEFAALKDAFRGAVFETRYNVPFRNVQTVESVESVDS